MICPRAAFAFRAIAANLAAGALSLADLEQRVAEACAVARHEASRAKTLTDVRATEPPKFTTRADVAPLRAAINWDDDGTGCTRADVAPMRGEGDGQ